MTKKLDYKKTLNETKKKLTMGENPFRDKDKNKNKILSDDEIKQLLDAISKGSEGEANQQEYTVSELECMYKKNDYFADVVDVATTLLASKKFRWLPHD